jgi:hypothetical protein
MISVLVFSECLGLLLGSGPNNEVILTCFDLFDIFLVNVYRWNDICRGKSNSITISEPPKIILDCKQYDTTDVYGYDLVIYYGAVFIHYFLFIFTEAIVSVASMDATPLGGIRIMCPTGSKYLPMNCRFSELTLWKIKLSKSKIR